MKKKLPKENPIEVFISYAHEDEVLCGELCKHLKALKRQGLITEWHDHQISAGSEWENEIISHLNSAKIILLLISPDFIDSDFCYDVEVKRSIERHNNNEARVIPIILRPAKWDSPPLNTLQALPHNAKPVTTWKKRDEAFVNILEGIESAIREMRDFSDKLPTMPDARVPEVIPSPQAIPTHKKIRKSPVRQPVVWLILLLIIASTLIASLALFYFIRKSPLKKLEGKWRYCSPPDSKDCETWRIAKKGNELLIEAVSKNGEKRPFTGHYLLSSGMIAFSYKVSMTDGTYELLEGDGSLNEAGNQITGKKTFMGFSDNFLLERIK